MLIFKSLNYWTTHAKPRNFLKHQSQISLIISFFNFYKNNQFQHLVNCVFNTISTCWPFREKHLVLCLRPWHPLPLLITIELISMQEIFAKFTNCLVVANIFLCKPVTKCLCLVFYFPGNLHLDCENSWLETSLTSINRDENLLEIKVGLLKIL